MTNMWLNSITLIITQGGKRRFYERETDPKLPPHKTRMGRKVGENTYKSLSSKKAPPPPPQDPSTLKGAPLPSHSPPKKVGRIIATETTAHTTAESKNTKPDGTTRQPELAPKPLRVKIVSSRPKSRPTKAPTIDIEEGALKPISPKTNGSEYEGITEGGKLETDSKRNATKILDK